MYRRFRYDPKAQDLRADILTIEAFLMNKDIENMSGERRNGQDSL
jgi:hypothetical protein